MQEKWLESEFAGDVLRERRLRSRSPREEGGHRQIVTKYGSGTRMKTVGLWSNEKRQRSRYGGVWLSGLKVSVQAFACLGSSGL